LIALADNQPSEAIQQASLSRVRQFLVKSQQAVVGWFGALIAVKN